MRSAKSFSLLFFFAAGSLLTNAQPGKALVPAGIHRTPNAASADLAASYALIHRILPQQAGQFIIELFPSSNFTAFTPSYSSSSSSSAPSPGSKDSFGLSSRNGKIVLRGNNGVAIASALYYYLNEYCHCQITWNGTRLTVPSPLPKITSEVRKRTPYEDRYYLNYCTFNYSMSWWDWDRWEKEIDWMALHGINMPLAITGEEYTWYTVYRAMGFTQEELRSFFSGPAYFAWFWMGNLDGWGGPLPLSWMKSHAALQKKILERERALGMKPVLPAFTGHVPAAFQKHFPAAKLKQTNWKNGFADTYILDSQDPLFASIGKKFIDAQTKLFGTDHLYSADTFNENEPPSDDPAFLAGLSRRLYEGMRQADPDAVWVMQGWLFYSDRKFWKAPQIKALLDAVPDDHMLLLDLATEIEPVWKRTDAFYGKPWIWNMLHNFGGNISLFGRIEGVAAGPASALHDSSSGRLKGIGLTMEGIEQNPVLYELMTHHIWQDQPIDPDRWLPSYIANRYGQAPESALRAWQILRATVYNGKDIRDGAESILTGRPTFSPATVWTRTQLNYDPAILLEGWDQFLTAARSCGSADGFQYDLADCTRQVLANYALPVQAKWVAAYRAKDTAAFGSYSRQFLELLDDMDRLLATRKDFLLGPWIADARRWGTTDAERRLFERNARDLITLWGDADSKLHEYSCRQWSGLLKDFYRPRWQQFFDLLNRSLRNGQEPDLEGFEKTIRQWEWAWVNERKDYPLHPSGNTVEVATELYKKYRKPVGEIYKTATR
ncbi:MAG TPA: alpha-N-acetylglucosaminidase [Puia sp.]|jgi:alpha-N-acetylglucosaminidase